MYNNFGNFNPLSDKKPILHQQQYQQPIPNLQQFQQSNPHQQQFPQSIPNPQQFQQQMPNPQQFQQQMPNPQQFQQQMPNPQQFQQPANLPPNFQYPQAPMFYNPTVSYNQMPPFPYQQQQESTQVASSNIVDLTNEIPQIALAKEPSSNIIQAPSVKYRQPQVSQVPMQISTQPQTTFQNPSFNYPPQQIPQARPSGQNFSQYGPTSTLNQFRTSTLYTVLPIKTHEVSSHYQNRKQVYEKVLNDLNDHDKAICYSNIWCHMNYLGTRYPENVEETVIKYGPFLPKVLRQKAEPQNPPTDTKRNSGRQNTRLNLKE